VLHSTHPVDNVLMLIGYADLYGLLGSTAAVTFAKLQAEGRLYRYDDELVPRAVARRMLGGIGRDQIAKLEAEGKLHPVKLTNSDKGHVYYLRSEVLALMRPPPSKPKIERAALRLQRK
jgi:hypothetical protein